MKYSLSIVLVAATQW